MRLWAPAWRFGQEAATLQQGNEKSLGVAVSSLVTDWCGAMLPSTVCVATQVQPAPGRPAARPGERRRHLHVQQPLRAAGAGRPGRPAGGRRGGVLPVRRVPAIRADDPLRRAGGGGPHAYTRSPHPTPCPPARNAEHSPAAPAKPKPPPDASPPPQTLPSAPKNSGVAPLPRRRDVRRCEPAVEPRPHPEGRPPPGRAEIRAGAGASAGAPFCPPPASGFCSYGELGGAAPFLTWPACLRPAFTPPTRAAGRGAPGRPDGPARPPLRGGARGRRGGRPPPCLPRPPRRERPAWLLRVGRVHRARRVRHEQRQARRHRVGVRPDAHLGGLGRRGDGDPSLGLLRRCATDPPGGRPGRRAESTARRPRALTRPPPGALRAQRAAPTTPPRRRSSSAPPSASPW